MSFFTKNGLSHLLNPIFNYLVNARQAAPSNPLSSFNGKRQVICWIENHFKKIDNYIEH